MTFTRNIAAALLIASAAWSSTVQAQQNSIQRTDLVQNDITVPGREIVQARVDFEPGAVSIKHSHPGEEVAYVLEGTIEYQLEGRRPVTLKAGQSLFIPAGAPHVAKNVGEGKASELATYVVQKAVPLVVKEK